MNHVRLATLEDESDFLQFGQSNSHDFYNFRNENVPQASQLKKFPDFYKFTGLVIDFDYDLQTTNRQTYSFLDWMGDLGGLFEALNYVFFWLLSPFTAYAFESRLISHLFRQSSQNRK